ncbi:site-specific integrase [Microvirga vignae]|nr:site-specific integrase [Microvirga vignae]
MMRLEGRSTGVGRVRKLLTITDWMLAQKILRFSDITPVDWDDFKVRVKWGAKALTGSREVTDAEGITAEAILEYFRLFQHLYDFHQAEFTDGGRLLPDGLLFKPFSAKEDAISLARALGEETGKTKTIPTHVALYALNAAIEWVVEHGPEILSLREQAAHEWLLVEREHTDRVPRPSSSEVNRRLANAIGDMLESPEKIPLYGSTISRTSLAAQIGISPPPLYSNSVCVEMIDMLQDIMDNPEGSVSPGKRDRLLVLIKHWSSVPAQSSAGKIYPARIARDVAERIRLPFTGSKRTKGEPWPVKVLGSSIHERRSLEAVTNHLWTASFLVIAAFMADRLEEVLETEVDCLILDRPEGPYFVNKAWKDTHTESGIESARPCPEVVVKAAEILRKLGAQAREETGSAKLFMCDHRHGCSVADETTARKRLDAFCQWIGIPADETGELWSIAPHQLRRFFVQAFTWQYELGVDLLALKQHLRQADLETTIRYATSALLGEMLNEEEKALTVFIMEKAAFDGLELSGGYGEHLLRAFSRLRVRVGPPEKLAEAIRKHQEKHNILLKPNPWGYCVWSLSRARFAECARREGITAPAGPVAAHRSSRTCGKCLNLLTHSGFAPFWRTAQARFEAMLAVPGIPPVCSRAAQEGITISRRFAHAGSRQKEGTPHELETESETAKEPHQD